MIRRCTTDTKCILRQSPAQCIYVGHKFLTKVKLEIVTLHFGLSCEGPLPTPNLTTHAYLLLKSHCLLLAIHIRSRIAFWVGVAKLTCSKVGSRIVGKFPTSLSSNHLLQYRMASFINRIELVDEVARTLLELSTFSWRTRI